MEQGILTLRTNVSTAYECERGLAIAEAMDLSARMEACIADSKVHTYKSYDPTSVI